MRVLVALLLAAFVAASAASPEPDLAATVKLLQEQVSALLVHRQQDYDALEASLKQSIEKNTELLVLKNEIKQLRKEVRSLGGGDGSGSSGNESKNERLRVRWLGSAVAELQAELSELVRSSNASEELAERARASAELGLLRADVAGLGRGLGQLGARLDRLEPSLAGLTLDAANAKRTTAHLARTCAQITHQLSDVQSELKVERNEVEQASRPGMGRHAWSRLASAARRQEERATKLEHKLALGSRRRAALERRLALVEGKLGQLEAAGTRRAAELASLATSVEVAGRAENLTKELEHVEDEYRLMVDALPGNCRERDGLTLLAPGPGAPLLAACRRGWVVVARRTDGTVDFDRSWNDYATGFGSPINEFWAGNEALHRLSRGNCTRLRVDLTDIDGDSWTASYEHFSVGSEDDGYRLQVDGYSGNATDAMAYQNDMRFSARDRDLDISATDCANNYHGGWWFSHCQHANLNARYSLGLTWYRSDTNQWMAIASAELSVQRKQHCT